MDEQKIEALLKKYPKAKQIAVENFLMSLTGDKMADGMNLSADAKSYGWNTQTIQAIREGIRG
jgi:hypothetical protein